MEFKFIESIRDCFLYQHVISPTRGRGSDNPSVIDLVLTSEEEIISELNINPPLGKSDHSVIDFICTINEDIDSRSRVLINMTREIMINCRNC